MLGILLIPSIVCLSKKLHIYDLPDSRKVHENPIPRFGGTIFFPVVSITITVLYVVMAFLDTDNVKIFEGLPIQQVLAYFSGGMVLYAIGLYDDIHGLSYKMKFLAQFIAALVLCIGGLWITNLQHLFLIDELPIWISAPLTVLFVVYITNAMNLIDGIDGLSSGLATISLLVIAALNIITANYICALVAVTYLGVVLAFFYYNVFSKKYKIFMGDAGSLTLGYTLSFLTLSFWQKDVAVNSHFENIALVALSTLIIPAFDVVSVMMCRIIDGRSPFLPDKNHIHHKFMRAGLSQIQTMLTLLSLSVTIVIINYVIAMVIEPALIILLDGLFFILIQLIINHCIYRKGGNIGSLPNMK